MSFEEEPGGSRPDRLAGVRPQERVQQHFVDQFVDTAPALPILHVPVPLMGEQLVEVLRFFDTLCPVAEQVIDVPKISLEDIPVRRLCREPQLVEQLVEVPTVVSYSSLLQRTVEQHVDIPVPRGRGRLANLQGSSPGQSSTAFVEQIIDIPGGGLQGFRPGSPASSFHSPAESDDDADKAGTGVFALFHRLKKVRRSPRSALRFWMLMTTLGCGWTRCMAQGLLARVHKLLTERGVYVHNLLRLIGRSPRQQRTLRHRGLRKMALNSGTTRRSAKNARPS